MPRPKKVLEQEPEQVLSESVADNNSTATTTPPVSEPVVNPPNPDMMEVSKEEWNKLQEQMKMLLAVADKGRMFNYEQKSSGKPLLKVKLAKFNDKYIVGWRMDKDISIYHPTSGKQIGEEQVVEVLLQDEVGEQSKIMVNGYPSFNNMRYAERIECEVMGKKEDWQGNWTFDIKLPDGKLLSLDSRFVN